MRISNVEWQAQASLNLFKFSFTRLQIGGEEKHIEIYVHRSPLVAFCLETFEYRGYTAHNVDDILAGNDVKHTFTEKDAELFISKYLYAP